MGNIGDLNVALILLHKKPAKISTFSLPILVGISLYIKQNVDIFTEYLFHEFEKSLEKSEYTSPFKFADITPVHKKGSRFEKNNYRPVSILPVLSKVFEKCLYKQISSYFNDIFSKYQCGFRKGFSAQHCLLAMIEKWCNSMDQGKFFGAF